MSLAIAGCGFRGDVSALPAQVVTAGNVASGVNFSLFAYDAPGRSDIAVSGLQMGLINPVETGVVLVDRRAGAWAEAAGSVAVRAPGSDTSSRWTASYSAGMLDLSPAAIERLTGAPLTSVRCEHGLFARARRERLAHLFEALAIDAASPAPGDALFVESISLAILRCILTPAGGERPARRSPKLTAVQAETLRAFIAARSSDLLSLQELAAVVDLSEGHLVRAFRGTFGVTPYQYVLRARIEAAKTLMRGGELSLRDVARLAGFNDQSQMSRTFRRLTGRTPSGFAERDGAALDRKN